jgi:trans-aconitate methyltransferase
MTHMDLHADIQITYDQQDVTARIPLAGQVIPGLARHYQKLARAKNLPMQIEELAGRGWIRVQVPANADRDDVEVILDAARAFLGEAEAAALAEMAATSPAEVTVREWWASQRRQWA